MPTKKKRIGFIPRFDVLKVIVNISEEEKLSNSKVVNILIEEALYARGLIKEVEKTLFNNDFKTLIKKISDLKDMSYDYEFIFNDDKKEFVQSKNSTKLYMRFIQFLQFKKMIKIFEKYD